MSTDSTVNFLLENGWEINKSKGEANHWKHSVLWVSLDEAIRIQDNVDPESVKEFKMLNNLNSKYANLYNEYLDS
jgi:hypothetical protein